MKNLILTLAIALLISNNHAFSQIARGADVGWLSEMENSGRIWRDSNGVQRDLFDILDDYCINSIRLRVWVNPSGGWSGKQDVINLSKRAVAKGYRLMIDFHYSDSWADPGKQTKPAAWNNFSVQQLGQALYDHTRDVLNGLKAENVTPEWVQVGNETNNGMLWPEGQASTNMANYAHFVNRGYDAVKSVFPNTKVIVHVSNGYDNSLFRWNIGGLISNGAKFDIIAMSMYPDSPQGWQTYAQQTLTNMNDMISRYNKDIMISEIGLPVSAPQESRLLVEQVIKNLQSLDNNRGLGIFWWEPQAYNWRGYDKVAWNSGTGNNAYQATDAMKGFRYGCQPVQNQPPSVSFGPLNAGICSGSLIDLLAEASDADGNIEKVEFYDGATLLGTDYDAPYSFTWTGASAGSHSLSVVATDNLGASAASDMANITVHPTPGISITSPEDLSTIPSSNGQANVILSAIVTGAQVPEIEFSFGNGLIGRTQDNSFTWTGLVNGHYPDITATAVTDAGCKGTSSPISFTVATPTGISDVQTGSQVMVYPNPSSGDFTIEIAAPARVEIYNATGQLMERHATGEKIIFGGNYKPGIYLLRLQETNEAIRIVKE